MNVLNVTELCTLKCLTFVMCILHQFFKWRPRRRKRKHTHRGYFFFKVPDSQKTDNLKQQEKLSVLGFLFFNWVNHKSQRSLTQEDWVYLDPHNGSHNLKKKKQKKPLYSNKSRCFKITYQMFFSFMSYGPWPPISNYISPIVVWKTQFVTLKSKLIFILYPWIYLLDFK